MSTYVVSRAERIGGDDYARRSTVLAPWSFALANAAVSTLARKGRRGRPPVVMATDLLVLLEPVCSGVSALRDR